jgi:hypothetical protein
MHEMCGLGGPATFYWRYTGGCLANLSGLNDRSALLEEAMRAMIERDGALRLIWPGGTEYQLKDTPGAGRRGLEKETPHRRRRLARDAIFGWARSVDTADCRAPQAYYGHPKQPNKLPLSVTQSFRVLANPHRNSL